MAMKREGKRGEVKEHARAIVIAGEAIVNKRDYARNSR